MKRFAVALVLVVSVVAAVRSIPVGQASPNRSASGGDQIWLARYVPPVDDTGVLSRVAASPDGSRVFVVTDDERTIAYSATTGEQLWLSRIARTNLWAVAVSLDGSRVFVTGSDGGRVVTASYNAETGARLWISHWPAQPWAPGGGTAVAVSPDGTRVFVTGSRPISNDGWGYVTIGYDAATGTKLWARRYGKPNGGGSSETARSVAVSPDGSRVFVTGRVAGLEGWDYVTIAYQAETGKTLWLRRLDGQAAALAVSPDGASVVVTGQGRGMGGGDYVTLAYDSASGKTLWARNYNGPADGVDAATAIVFSPDGTQVAVTGMSAGVSSREFSTVSYAAATGKTLWVSRFGPFAYLPAIAFAPDGKRVYVTGSAHFAGPQSPFEYATVAYDASDGSQAWFARYTAAIGDNYAASVAVSPDSTSVYVTGSSFHDFVTIAYSTG